MIRRSKNPNSAAQQAQANLTARPYKAAVMARRDWMPKIPSVYELMRVDSVTGGGWDRLTWHDFCKGIHTFSFSKYGWVFASLIRNNVHALNVRCCSHLHSNSIAVKYKICHGAHLSLNALAVKLFLYHITLMMMPFL